MYCKTSVREMIRGGHQADKRQEQTNKFGYKIQWLDKKAPKALPAESVKGCNGERNLSNCRARGMWSAHTLSSIALLS